MKKWFVSLLIIAILFVAAVYIFIPSRLSASRGVYCKSSYDAAQRFIVSKQNWQKWWPGKSQPNDTAFTFDNNVYNLSVPLVNGGLVDIHHNHDVYQSEINLLRMERDTVYINWNFSADAGNNPFKRISNYVSVLNIKKDMNNILSGFKNFIQSDSNVYGIQIQLSPIDHIFLLTNKSDFNHNPSTKEIYEKINFLKNYSTQNNLKQTYYPMMNVLRNSDSSYRLMVGLPIDKEIKLYGYDLSFVRMVQGNFMVTEVNGGYGTINNALQQLRQYFDDYHKVSMAIPFQYIVTDRLNEPDTSKWITKIYAPVY